VLVIKVAANGKDFEDMINQHMLSNKKYDFLREKDNPYREYYLFELKK